MIDAITDFQHVYFVGIAGTGMSALAQYLKATGKKVAGSDRYFAGTEHSTVRTALEAEGIICHPQDGSGISESVDLVVVSTAIEDSVPDVQIARKLNIPILRRSELLALIVRSKKTIAIAGTSGKSSTAGMLFHLLSEAGLEPSVITGAGLTSLIRKGKIGNAALGKGDYLIIEADESDGSLVQYKPEIGVLLNVDKDHQEIAELMEVFTIFKNNTQGLFIVNQSNKLSKSLSANISADFGFEDEYAGYSVDEFMQESASIAFKIKEQLFQMKSLGRHSAENAAAAVAVAHQTGVDLKTCAAALSSYEGIYRRHQILGTKNGITLIDDYAHNPAKCAASIAACQPLTQKVIAWFQPHGYGPTRFLKNDFISEISKVLRPDDEIWMSEIFYAGGTATKDISAADLIRGIAANGKKAFFVEDRNYFLENVRHKLSPGVVLLLMGARDPGLERFAGEVYENL